MKIFYMELCFDVGGGPDGLEEHLGNVLDALYEDASVLEPDFTATLATGEVICSLGIESGDELDALARGLGAMRAAIHAAEGYTPGWEEHFTRLRGMVLDRELTDA